MRNSTKQNKIQNKSRKPKKTKHLTPDRDSFYFLIYCLFSIIEKRNPMDLFFFETVWFLKNTHKHTHTHIYIYINTQCKLCFLFFGCSWSVLIVSFLALRDIMLQGLKENVSILTGSNHTHMFMHRCNVHTSHPANVYNIYVYIYIYLFIYRSIYLSISTYLSIYL